MKAWQQRSFISCLAAALIAATTVASAAPSESTVAHSCNDFGLRLLKQVAPASKDNVVISPFGALSESLNT